MSFSRSPAPTPCQPCSTFVWGPMSVWLGGILLSTSVATPDERAFWKKKKKNFSSRGPPYCTHGNAQSWIIKELKMFKVNKMFVKRKLDQFKESGSSGDRPLSGRSRTAYTAGHRSWPWSWCERPWLPQEGAPLCSFPLESRSTPRSLRHKHHSGGRSEAVGSGSLQIQAIDLPVHRSNVTQK